MSVCDDANGHAIFDMRPHEVVPWRQKDRVNARRSQRRDADTRRQMRTVSVALVCCLNIGVDPPDVVKPQPCARLEAWIGASAAGWPGAWTDGASSACRPAVHAGPASAGRDRLGAAGAVRTLAATGEQRWSTRLLAVSFSRVAARNRRASSKSWTRPLTTSRSFARGCVVRPKRRVPFLHCAFGRPLC